MRPERDTWREVRRHNRSLAERLFHALSDEQAAGEAVQRAQALLRAAEGRLGRARAARARTQDDMAASEKALRAGGLWPEGAAGIDLHGDFVDAQGRPVRLGVSGGQAQTRQDGDQDDAEDTD